MQGVEYNGHEKLTLLELVLQLQGDFRRRLEPILVTPLQAGVLLVVCRHAEAKVTDAAAALGVSSDGGWSEPVTPCRSPLLRRSTQVSGRY